jgi:hypothetical protein
MPRDGSSEGSVVNEKPGIRRSIVTVVGFIALAVVPVLALNSLATADPGTSSTTEEGAGVRHGLTDAQRQCLAEQGVTLPARAVGGARPELSQEQRDALRQAAAACGLPAGPRRGLRVGLTDAQRQCLAEQGVTLPGRAADGTRPALTQEPRAAFRQAAAACGLWLPDRPNRVSV